MRQKYGCAYYTRNPRDAKKQKDLVLFSKNEASKLSMMIRRFSTYVVRAQSKILGRNLLRRSLITVGRSVLPASFRVSLKLENTTEPNRRMTQKRILRVSGSLFYRNERNLVAERFPAIRL